VLFTNSWRKRQNADLSRDYNWPMAIRPADPPRSAFCRVPKKEKWRVLGSMLL